MSLPESLRPAFAAALRAETDPELVGYVAARNDTMIAAWCNAVSTFIVWKKTMATAEVGLAANYIAVEAMTDANRNRINTFYTMNPSSFDPGRADIRTYWANTFSGALGGQGQATRDALDALWRRAATRAEKMFATGTGTTAVPGTLVFEGQIDTTDVGRSLNEF